MLSHESFALVLLKNKSLLGTIFRLEVELDIKNDIKPISYIKTHAADMLKYNAPFCQDSFSTSLRCPPVATLLAVNLLVLRRTRTLLLESGNLETDETVPCCRTQNIF